MDIVLLGVLVGIVVLVVAVGIISYTKTSPDVALVISGIKKDPRILIGSGGFVIPFLERKDKLYLGQMSVDIKTGISVPTKDFINVNVDAVAKIRIGKTDEAIKLASQNFLNLTKVNIAEDLQDSLEGNMREIVGTLTLEEINTDRDRFSDEVLKKASVDMQKLGIEILSCNIQNVSDENGLIEALGAENSSRILRDASISKANAERDIAIAEAEASKIANDSKVKAELEIAQKQNELDIKKAELKAESDNKKAQADAAYEIQKQEQEKIIQEKTVLALIKKAEKEAELKEKEVNIQKQILEAEISRKADADKYATEQSAMAVLVKNQRDAEAALYAQQKDAEAKKAEAEALKYAMEQEAAGIKAKAEAEALEIKLKAEAEAAGIKARNEAEAAGIRAKGEAEALAMEKKADAYQKYNDAAMAQMAIEILPKVASEIAKPLSSIDKVTIFGGTEGNNGVSGISSNVPIVMAQTFETIEEATGVDLKEIIRGKSYDAKVNRNIKVNLDSPSEE